MRSAEDTLSPASAGPGSGAGHGKCAEVDLLSDRLRQLDPQGAGITSADGVRDAGKGTRVYGVRIGERVGPHPLGHGEYEPPCRSCSMAMERAGITVYAGSGITAYAG
ncbi:YwqJ-related putative deaminase [Streptomyces sp. NPDC059247]|uniref:YwqJ-related putative deaminase n=1 Tax=Streptomyces sp. NPDC059247 TaxID=3346790 RepID=UPI003696D1CA